MGDMFAMLILSLGLCLCALLIAVYCLLVGMQLSAAAREVGEAAAAAVAEGEGGQERGLTVKELEKLEEGKMAMGGGGECAVCCEKMEETRAARVLPGCRHAFHRSCIDAWLQRHPSCPLCRARFLPPPPSLPPSQPQPQSPSS